jgi:thymidylate kinase
MLISLSGIDGAGKSTQLALLKEAYQRRGVITVLLWSRVGYTPGIETLKRLARRVLGSGLPRPGHSKERDALMREGLVQRFWITLSLLELIIIYGFVLRWRSFRGRVVLCDRYLWDSLIDLWLAFPNREAESTALWKTLTWAAAKPDAAIFLRIPLEESETRSSKKGDPFPDSAKERARRFGFYEDILKRGCWQCIDGNRGAEEVARDVMRLISQGERRSGFQSGDFVQVPPEANSERRIDAASPVVQEVSPTTASLEKKPGQ